MPGLEIAPGLLFATASDPFDPPPAVLDCASRKASAAGLTLCSMQSLLFGVKGAALFGSEVERDTFEAGILRAIRLASRLGVPNLVVGSPHNRVVPPGMGTDEAGVRGVDVFRRLGDMAAKHGCVLAMEPNPEVYGTNFLNTLTETDAFVRRVAHPAVTVNFDVGALHANCEFDAMRRLLDLSLSRVSHVHLSEPGLAAFPKDEETATTLFADLRSVGWTGWVSIEMRADSIKPLEELRRSVVATLAAMKGVG